MIGIKNLLAGITVNDLEEGDFFDYGLWYQGAEYSLRIEKFVGDRIDASLRHYGENIMPNRHIYADFSVFVDAVATKEKEIFDNRNIPFYRKPQALWAALENTFSIL